MDLSISTPQLSHCGFPRTRGDGPYSRIFPTANFWFPPHARGWTPLRYVEVVSVIVSPVRAGMDPALSVNDYLDIRFPRTRGDGPAIQARTSEYLEFPPHARGWTLEVGAIAGRLLVSPARAGMDPYAAVSMNQMTSFPRTRGDGPLRKITSPRPRPFPPHARHARGWTAGRLARPQGHPVSPARAGMDPEACGWMGRGAGFPRTRGDGP